MRRFRQITAAINRRKYFEERRQKSVVTWQTRQLASFIAAGYMTEGNNPALEEAANLAIDEIEREQIAERKIKVAETPMPTTEPVAGSYERFMGSMGNPKRWAGH